MIIEVMEKSPEIDSSCFIADTAVVCGDVKACSDSSIWFNTVVRGDINSVFIGSKTNIQDNCTVHVSAAYPTVIGSCTAIGHNAVIHACSIGDNVLIGIGAKILDGAVIGNNVIIGAGTIIPPGKVIEENSVVMGNPYKLVRPFSEKDREMLQGIVNRYILLSQEYKRKQTKKDFKGGKP